MTKDIDVFVIPLDGTITSMKDISSSIIVFEDELGPGLDNLLSHKNNKSIIKLNARSCDIIFITKQIAYKFLEENHLQGGVHTSLVEIGLFYNNDLVGVMLGAKHHRINDSDTFVLSRLAFKAGISVRGGSSKLLKALKQYSKVKGYKRLISWSDNRWTDGNVYLKLGFHLEMDMRPGYFYIRDNKRHSKQALKKNIVEKTMGLTELELRTRQGYIRIYDKGKKRWTMNL